MSVATKAVQSAATELQTLADILPPHWEDRFETIIDNLRDAFVKLADADEALIAWEETRTHA